MLEGGGVEDDVGAALGEDAPQAGGVADVGQHHVGRVEQGPAVHEKLGAVQRRLVPVEHDQLAGAEAGDLAAQLRADGASRAGDQHAAVGEVPGDRLDVGVHLGAAQQVGQLDVAQVAEGDAGRQQVVSVGSTLTVTPTWSPAR